MNYFSHELRSHLSYKCKRPHACHKINTANMSLSMKLHKKIEDHTEKENQVVNSITKTYEIN